MATLADAKGTVPSPPRRPPRSPPPTKPPPRKQYQQSFDDLLKGCRALCKDLNLPSSPTSNPVLARLHALTSTAVGGPFPPPLLSLSSPALTPPYVHLLLRLLTCAPLRAYQANFGPPSHVAYPGLRNLQLWGCPVGDGGVAHLADLLPSLPSLTTLSLFNCHLTPLACTHLARYLSPPTPPPSYSLSPSPPTPPRPSLLSLTLDHNPIGDSGLTLLAPALARSALTHLSLAFCALSPRTPLDALPTLLTSPSLTSLSLQGNPLTLAVLAPLTAALTSVPCTSVLASVDLRMVGLCAMHEGGEVWGGFVRVVGGWSGGGGGNEGERGGVDGRECGDEGGCGGGEGRKGGGV